MQKFVRSSIVVLAFVAAMFGGSGSAQLAFPDSPLRSEWAASMFVVLSDGFAGPSGPDRELGNEMIYAMQRGAGVPSDAPRTLSTCAHVLGAGSDPKLDGGGNLLAARPGGIWSPGMVVEPTELATGMIPRVDTIVIVDAFDLYALAYSLMSSIPLRIDEEDGFQQLWNTLYVHIPGDGNSAAAGVPHGHLVAYHALAHLGGTGAVITNARVLEPGTPENALALTVEFVDGVTVQVHLVKIVFDDPDSMAIVEDVMGQFGQANAVIVTSWGLVDCALGKGYSEATADGSSPANATFVDYLTDALASDSEAETHIRRLCSAFKDRIDMAITPASIDCNGSIDFLLDLGTVAAIAAMSVQAAEDVGMRLNGDWVNVSAGVFASAGNQGLPFPMPPAAWPGIVGVEACVRDQGRSSFSNAASLAPAFGDQSVRALGAWFATNMTSDGTRLGYWGTSFAAPAAAMQYAATQAGWQQLPIARTEALPPCQP